MKYNEKKKMTMSVFSKRIKELRKERNLSQKKLADVLKYGNSAISNYEHGKNEPSIRNLISIANFFEVSVDYLIGASDEKYKNN